jgi:hypothetical protein
VRAGLSPITWFVIEHKITSEFLSIHKLQNKLFKRKYIEEMRMRKDEATMRKEEVNYSVLPVVIIGSPRGCRNGTFIRPYM